MALLACALLAAGCSTQRTRHEQSDFEQLQRALPGSYDSTRSGDAAGSSAAQPVTLSIQLVRAQLVGDTVYFVRETPSDNPRLVLEQRIWILTLDPMGRIIQHMLLFKDPRRWTGVASEPDLLESMLPQDLQALAGCDLQWQHAADAFTATAPPQACHPGAASQGLWVTTRLHLGDRQLQLSERRTGADGALDSGETSITLVRGSAATP